MAVSEGARHRREQHKEQLRREILDAAGLLFAEEGYEHVTVRRIAERISYSQGVIFYYFENKGQILTAICEETFSQLIAILREIETPREDPVERLLAASRAFVQFGIDHPHHYRVVFTPPSSMDGVDSIQRIGELGDELWKLLGGLYQRCLDSGRFHAVHPFEARLAWWNALSGLIVFFIMHRNSSWVRPEVMTEECLRVLLAGSRALSEDRPPAERH